MNIIELFGSCKLFYPKTFLLNVLVCTKTSYDIPNTGWATVLFTDDLDNSDGRASVYHHVDLIFGV